MASARSPERPIDDANGGLRGRRATPSRQLLNAICDAYGFDRDQDPVDLGGSSNLNLLLQGDDERYVARVYRPYVTSDRLRNIHHVRDRLVEAGVPCGGVRPARGGARWIVFDGRLVEVEPFVERDAKMDSWDRLESGMQMLGRIHRVLRDIDVGPAGRTPMFANHIGSVDALERTMEGTRRIRGWRPSSPELELAVNVEALARVVSAGERSFAERMPHQMVHGDFWDDNVLFLRGRLVFVTDFDFMGERPRIDDVALTLYFTAMEFFERPVSDGRLDRLRALLDAYDDGADPPLTLTERRALAWALARQPLWSIGGWVASLDDEIAAREHAASMPEAVGWALEVVQDMDRWQHAFA